MMNKDAHNLRLNFFLVFKIYSPPNITKTEYNNTEIANFS